MKLKNMFVQWKKPDTNGYIMHDSIHMVFKKGHNWFVMVDIGMVVVCGV